MYTSSESDQLGQYLNQYHYPPGRTRRNRERKKKKKTISAKPTKKEICRNQRKTHWMSHSSETKWKDAQARAATFVLSYSCNLFVWTWTEKNEFLHSDPLFVHGSSAHEAKSHYLNFMILYYLVVISQLSYPVRIVVSRFSLVVHDILYSSFSLLLPHGMSGSDVVLPSWSRN